MSAVNPVDLVRYEIEGSWWACKLKWPWARALAGRHFANVVVKKLARAQARKDRLAYVRFMLNQP